MTISLVLIVHATLGFIALASACVVLARKKKDEIHKQLGYAFIVTAIGSMVAGVVVAVQVDMLFFVNLAIATSIQLALGISALSNKQFNLGKLEMFIIGASLINALGFMLYGTSVTYALGSIYGLLALYQVYLFSGYKQITKMLWLAQHIGNMLGAVTTVITAFVIGNVGDLANMGLVWVLPALVGAVFIRHFRLKYAPDRAVKIKDWKW